MLSRTESVDSGSYKIRNPELFPEFTLNPLGELSPPSSRVEAEKWETHMKGIYCENDAGKIRKSHFQSLVLESSCSALEFNAFLLLRHKTVNFLEKTISVFYSAEHLLLPF